MQITLLINPKSGRGTAKKASKSLEQELRRRGHTVVMVETNTDAQELESVISDSDRVVVLGGDGTVHYLLSVLTKTDTPLYHLGTGTANLICKEFKMSQSPMTVVEHLEAEFEPTVVDVPTCNGVPFLIMVSLGIDASVIHRFEESRKHKGGYRAYIQPIIREVLSPRLARIVVESADQQAHPPYPMSPINGVLVIANLRSYGGYLNPCPDADPTDGLLDAVAIPCDTSVGCGVQLGMLRARQTTRCMKRMKSAAFRVTAPQGRAYVQIDGEKATRIPGLIDGVLVEGQEIDVSMNGLQIHLHAPI